MRITIFLTHKEVACWNFNSRHASKLQSVFPEAEIVNCKNEEDFTRYLPETEIAIIWTFKQEWLKLASKLKKIVTPAAGKDYFNITPSENLKIEYSSFHGRIIGETIAAMVLSHSRGILRSYELQKKTAWPRKELNQSMRLLSSLTITIPGFGNIGTWAGKLLKPFGPKIIGIKRIISNSPEYFDKEDKILSIDNLDSVLPVTDHLILCLPGNKETNLLINKKRLNLLPRHSVIYNVGRGNSIDEKALYNALTNRKISAAYLDVFQKEPLSLKSPLRDCPGCYIMPHISAVAPEYMDMFLEEFIEKNR